MCLRIDFKKHPYSGKPVPEPKIAKRNIKCYKVLYTTSTKGKYFTPYMLKTVDFRKKNEQCIKIQEGYSLQPKCCFDFTFVIHEGVHAYRTTKNTKELLIHLGEKSHVFDAYIPKGTKYFIGENNDIVAEILIVKNNKVLF